MYSAVYGRRCSVPYTNHVVTLNDAMVHLTNYSVQKKAEKSGLVSDKQQQQQQQLQHQQMYERLYCHEEKNDENEQNGASIGQYHIPHAPLCTPFNTYAH